MLKASGYLISTVSVILLGVASWEGLQGKPLLQACLIFGMTTSILGMAVRWRSFQKDEKPPRT